MTQPTDMRYDQFIRFSAAVQSLATSSDVSMSYADMSARIEGRNRPAISRRRVGFERADSTLAQSNALFFWNGGFVLAIEPWGRFSPRPTADAIVAFAERNNEFHHQAVELVVPQERLNPLFQMAVQHLGTDITPFIGGAPLARVVIAEEMLDHFGDDGRPVYRRKVDGPPVMAEVDEAFIVRTGWGIPFSIHPTGYIDAGLTPRGYRMVAARLEDDTYISSGCRWFTSNQALRHWSADNADYVAAHGAAVAMSMARLVHALLDKARRIGWPVAAAVVEE